jgi:hypothetical protein
MAIMHQLRSASEQNLVEVRAIPPFAKCAKDGAPKARG